MHADDELVNSAAAAAVMIAHDELVEKYTVRTSTRTSYLSLKRKRGKEEGEEEKSKDICSDMLCAAVFGEPLVL